jgi:hypothetical protein
MILNRAILLWQYHEPLFTNFQASLSFSEQPISSHRYAKHNSHPGRNSRKVTAMHSLTGPYAATFQRIRAIGQKRLFILASMATSFESLSLSGLSAVGSMVDLVPRLDERSSMRGLNVDSRTSDCFAWMSQFLFRTSHFKVLVQRIQDDVLVPFQEYRDTYSCFYAQYEVDMCAFHRTYAHANESYVTTFKKYLDVCEHTNSVACDLAASDELRAECTAREGDVVAECERLGQAKREYALVAERMILRFEAMEREFFTKITEFSDRFARVIDAFGAAFVGDAPDAARAVANLRAQIARPAMPREVGTSDFVDIPQLSPSVFQFLKPKTILAGIAARLRIAIKEIEPDIAKKGDFLLIVEERGKELYVRNDASGKFAVVAAADVVELPNGGRKNFRKVLGDIVADGIPLAKGQCVIIVGFEDRLIVRCHTAQHKVVTLPMTALKKVSV